MKVFAASLAVLLLVAICSLAEAAPRVGASSKMQAFSTSCCLSYISRPIPRRIISSAYRTSKKCPQLGVVLVTVKGRNVCANPEEPWVQKYLAHFETLES